MLLLDEIEKAHPDVFNLLLQVMDHGTLTDNNGRKADFRHVIIVMTTNAGAHEMSRPSIGFMQADNASDGMEAIRRLFSPEFRNRLDAVIQFAPLDAVTIERVVDKLLIEVEAQLEPKGVSVILDESARRWIAEKGYDPKMGARPMRRLIRSTSSARWLRSCYLQARRRRYGARVGVGRSQWAVARVHASLAAGSDGLASWQGRRRGRRGLSRRAQRRGRRCGPWTGRRASSPR